MNSPKAIVMALSTAFLCCSLVQGAATEYPSRLPADVGKYEPGETIDIHKGLSDREWPQLGNTPQRTNYSPVEAEPPYRIRWQVKFPDFDPVGTTYAATQAIMADGRVYVGCKSGILYAFDARDGEMKWKFESGGAILHTAGYARGKVFFAAMDGRVYALDAANGKEAWVFDNGRRYGFSTAVLLAEDQIFMADRGGYLYALDQADGKKLWHYDATAPVLHSTAYNDGRVYFASEDMRVHAVKAADGSRLWRSEQLAGMSFMDFWPVVTGGKVIVRSMMSWGSRLGDYKDPMGRSMFVLDEQTGEQVLPFQHYPYGMHGPHPPPAVTRDGLLVVPWRVVEQKQYFHETAKGDRGWALQDVKTQTMVAKFFHTGEPMAGVPEKLVPGIAATDETLIASVIGDIAIVVHHHSFWTAGGGSQQYGAYHLTERRWHLCPLPSGWTRVHNTQGGGANAISAADGLLYQIATGRWLVCYEPANKGGRK